MKKYLFLLFAGIAGLVSCGDDDKPSLPELNKLTKVTCYKNNSLSPEFVLDITYTSEGQIAYMTENNPEKKQFLYAGNTILVAGLSAEDVTSTEYTLSNKTIVRKKVSDKNPYKGNEIYVRDDYKYGYRNGNLVQTSWTALIPKSDGKYETKQYNEAELYTWENGNAVRFTEYTREMVYEYGTGNIRPLNFPFRVIASFAPTGMEQFTPLNLQYGTLNRNLPSRAYWYNVPDTSVKQAEYTYSFSMIGDYITGMTIMEQIYSVDGKAGETNTYSYTFEYAV